MQASVQNGVGHALVDLDVADRREIGPAGRREKPSHLNRERESLTQSADRGRGGVQPLRLGAVGIRGKIVRGQSGTVLQPFRAVSVLFAEAVAEGREHCGLLLDHGELAFLRSGKIVQARDVDLRMKSAPRDQRAHLRGVHSELAARRQAEEDAKVPARTQSLRANHLVLPGAFRGQNAHPVRYGPGYILWAFVHAGVYDLLHIRSGAFAYFELPGTADLDPVKLAGEHTQKERIGLYGKAQADAGPEGAADQPRTLSEGGAVEAVGRGRYRAGYRSEIHLTRPASAGSDPRSRRRN